MTTWAQITADVESLIRVEIGRERAFSAHVNRCLHNARYSSTAASLAH